MSFADFPHRGTGNEVTAMRRPRHGLTITELLTVVSVITILTSMMSPMLIRTRQEAGRAKCTANMRNMSQGLELYRNINGGKFPKCFDMKSATSTQVQENSWWYRKLARIIYPTDTVGGTLYDVLNVPRTTGKGKVPKFRSENICLRCSASRDAYDQTHSPTAWPKATSIDKDRVHDDNYGYSNYGFNYASGYGDTCTIYYPPPHICTLYHTGGSYCAGKKIRGSYVNNPASNYTHIGAIPDFAEPAITMVIMDYLKGDVAPNIDHGKVVNGNEYMEGYVFRHGGKANVLFADGHIEGYRERLFYNALADEDIRWGVRRRP